MRNSHHLPLYPSSELRIPFALKCNVLIPDHIKCVRNDREVCLDCCLDITLELFHQSSELISELYLQFFEESLIAKSRVDNCFSSCIATCSYDCVRLLVASQPLSWIS